MEKFWRAALGVAGIGAVGAFVLWSLYRDWLKLPLFSRMTSDQTFVLMLVFLALTFVSLIAMLLVHLRSKSIDAGANKVEDLRSNVSLVDAQLDPRSPHYRQTTQGDREVISRDHTKE
jgi:hypothetical protein